MARPESSPLLRFAGLNLRKTRAANSLLTQLLIERRIGVALIQDACRIEDRIFGFPSAWPVISTQNLLAAVVLPNTAIPFSVIFKREYYVAVALHTLNGTIHLCSLYAPPSADYQAIFDQLDADLAYYEGPWIIHGDFNAKSGLWGCREEDDRGSALWDILSKHHLCLVNPVDAPPSVVIHLGSGHPDLTWASPVLMCDIKDWTVLPDYTASDHLTITWTLATDYKPQVLPRLKTGYIPTEFLAGRLRKEFAKRQVVFPQNPNNDSVDRFVHQLVDTTLDVATGICSWKKPPDSRKLAWWNTSLLLRRRRLQALRRRYTRANEENRGPYWTSYKKEAAAYKKAINAAKTSSWRAFCNQESGPFDVRYKTWRGKLFRPQEYPPIDSNHPEDITCTGIFRHLFPGSVCKRALEKPHEAPATDTCGMLGYLAFTYDDVNLAFRCMDKNKAPGPYGLDYHLLRAVYMANPHLLLDLMNHVLATGHLPWALRVSTLILLQKKDKPPSSPGSYRPICLAPHITKLLDKALLHRLLYHLKTRGGLSPVQFGFTEGRNTEQALHHLLTEVRGLRGRRKYSAIVSADIKAAFDSILHADIERALIRNGVPYALSRAILSFAKNRSVVFSHPERSLLVHTARGVPQGSSLGPILWNLVLDGFLSSPITRSLSITAFADDINIVVSADSRRHLEEAGDSALALLRAWTTTKSLTLSFDKTKVLLMFSAAKLKRSPLFHLEGTKVQTVKCLRILGCHVDSHLTWDPTRNT